MAISYVNTNDLIPFIEKITGKKGRELTRVVIDIKPNDIVDVHVYLHRIGRSGRWGRKGSALNFVTKFDYHLLKQIEQYYNTEINELPQSFNEV